eukprot:TRINITY_DN3652_c0_g1_i1.p2 TRINITY_DN3652_c0_g1~~TRINITY_DN3652_c0_g1_i1.p2  ORF type:complete len:436 (+),score=113.14 TRINITY_DN3652_c0_g1_i1:61-1308(+)
MPVFAVDVAADLFGDKHNYRLQFPGHPSLADLREKVADVYSRRVDVHPDSANGACFAVEYFELYDRERRRWADLVRASQLTSGCQLYCWQPASRWHRQTPEQPLPPAADATEVLRKERPRPTPQRQRPAATRRRRRTPSEPRPRTSPEPRPRPSSRPRPRAGSEPRSRGRLRGSARRSPWRKSGVAPRDSSAAAAVRSTSPLDWLLGSRSAADSEPEPPSAAARSPSASLPPRAFSAAPPREAQQRCLLARAPSPECVVAADDEPQRPISAPRTRGRPRSVSRTRATTRSDSALPPESAARPGGGREQPASPTPPRVAAPLLVATLPAAGTVPPPPAAALAAQPPAATAQPAAVAAPAVGDGDSAAADVPVPLDAWEGVLDGRARRDAVSRVSELTRQLLALRESFGDPAERAAR